VKNDIALVTGAARRIGRDVAIKLSRAGFAIAAHFHSSKPEADELIRQIRSEGGEAKAFGGDLRDWDFAAGLVEQVCAEFGRPNLLVNSAALFLDDRAENFQRATWRAQFAVNLEAPVLLAQSFARALPSDETGAIVNIVDQRVLRLTPQNFSYTLAKAAALRVIGPLARAVAAGSEGVSSLRDDVRLQGSLRSDNARLRDQVESLELRLLRLSSVEEELQRLAQAVRYATPLLGELRAVDVVYADHSPWLRSLILYCGNQPAKVDEPVLSPAGLVGRVVTVAGAYAKVQLITDRAAQVGVLILRTRRQGVVRGAGDEAAGLALDYVPLQADVRPGDRLLTAGIDGIYPRGVPVGTVLSVDAGGQLFHRIRVAAAVDFGSLDQVYLLAHPTVPAELEKAQPGARR